MPYVPPNMDPFFIPTAPGGISGPDCPLKERRFVFLNSRNQESFALNLMSYGGRPGFQLVQCPKAEDTRKLCLALGLSEGYFNAATNRIQYAELVLAAIPLEEWHRRQEELQKMERDKMGAQDEAFLAAIDGIPGIEPVREQRGETVGRMKHAAREGKPFVSLTPVKA